MENLSSLVVRVMTDTPITKHTIMKKCNMLMLYVTEETSKVKTQAGDGAQLTQCLPSVSALTVKLTAYSHMREKLPRAD